MSWFLLNPLLKFSPLNPEIAMALATEAYGSHPSQPQSRENVARMKIRLSQVWPRRRSSAMTLPCCCGGCGYGCEMRL